MKYHAICNKRVYGIVHGYKLYLLSGKTDLTICSDGKGMALTLYLSTFFLLNVLLDHFCVCSCRCRFVKEIKVYVVARKFFWLEISCNQFKIFKPV